MSSDEHVLIIGGGIAGVAMSICLDKAGIHSTVYEGYPHHKHAGASFVVAPNGQRILQSLGLGAELAANSVPDPGRIRFFSSIDEEIASFHLPPQNATGTPDVCVERAELLRILLGEAARRGIQVHYGKRLFSLEQGPQSVTAHFEDGSQATGSLLIGADGAKSRVRSALFPHVQLQHKKTWAVYGKGSADCLTAEERELIEKELVVYEKDGLNVLLYQDHPTKPENYAWLLTGKTERKIPSKNFEHKPKDELRADLAKLFADWTGPVPRMVATSRALTPVQLFRIGRLPSWSSGRVALIGDAVHTTNPISGLGVTLALEDALHLSRMLREHDYQDAFFYYCADRQPQVDEILEAIPDLFDSITSLLSWPEYAFPIDWSANDDASLV
ncbi:FAD-dependent oxidoreductase [Streptomyces sp. NPDC059092]|uniref:FAD-dependent oxidoreductase n=1 Tax=Streptomyces sp. NPDC059092 TaxID=3346725 RepID=UPI0036755E0D